MRTGLLNSWSVAVARTPFMRAFGVAPALVLSLAPPASPAQDCVFSSGAMVQDLDQDGALTPADIALWLKDQLDDQPMEDLDGDGLLTEADLHLFLEDFVRSFAGDLDGDGMITSLDLHILVDNMGADRGLLVNNGDVNGDGVIDAEDFLIVAAKVGCPLDDEIVQEVIRGLLGSLLFLPYNELGGGLMQELSAHYPFFSDTWGDHDEVRSGIWPPSHEGSISMEWPGPGVHQSSSSGMWPPSHLYSASALWDMGSHDVFPSRLWGPNHRLQRSQTWPHDHRFAVSRYWPPGHWVEPSTTWPGERPWPPNHFLADSEQWSRPPRRVPLMPPDHSIWASGRDLTPLLEGEPAEP